jgi:hypothetical protein
VRNASIEVHRKVMVSLTDYSIQEGDFELVAVVGRPQLQLVEAPLDY